MSNTELHNKLAIFSLPRLRRGGCIELHFGTVLRTLSPRLLAVTKLGCKLGQNNATEQSDIAATQSHYKPYIPRSYLFIYLFTFWPR